MWSTSLLPQQPRKNQFCFVQSIFWLLCLCCRWPLAHVLTGPLTVEEKIQKVAASSSFIGLKRERWEIGGSNYVDAELAVHLLQAFLLVGSVAARLCNWVAGWVFFVGLICSLFRTSFARCGHKVFSCKCCLVFPFFLANLSCIKCVARISKFRRRIFNIYFGYIFTNWI